MVNRFRAAGLAVLLMVSWAAPALAAPLFPDVPENHWARDAVASLAAKGLVEGYPDGTFKGDRAATRWEVAMVVARLLAKMEQEHATFATKAELEEVRKLVSALREELDALGVRVTNLEESTARLDQRVTDLERITFYGLIEARAIAQTFYNTGAPDNDNGRGGGGLPGGIPFVNYNSAVGAAPIAAFRPQTHGIIPLVDYWEGRMLNNGTGFTARMILGLKVKVSPDVDAAAEFAAYTSQGDRFIDAYWGVPAPFLSNPFTASGVGSPLFAVQSLDNTPYTKVTLDNFWVHHKPSKTRVRLGNIEKLTMDPIVYVGEGNNSVWPPGRFPGFGAQATGEVPVGEGGRVRWEGFYGHFGTANLYLANDYRHEALGGDVAYEWGKGAVRVNFARVMDEAPPGGPLVEGLIAGMNVRYGASPGWSVVQWVNPPGHFAAQRSQFEQNNTGAVAGVLVPNTVDTRPIPGWNGAADNAVGIPTGGGNFGPQGQDVYGITGRHEWDVSDDMTVGVKAEWAHSDYKPNRNSSYTAGGDALRGEVGVGLLGGDLDLAAYYLSVDPDYGPYTLRGGVNATRNVRTFGFAGGYQVYDNRTYPGNREGFGLEGVWRFDEDRGAVRAEVNLLDQKRTSLYDVRAVPGSAGFGAPNFPVLGFAPGFRDDIFPGFASPLLYGANSGSSFTDALQPLENPRGSADDYELGVNYKWADPAVRVNAVYQHVNYFRPTALAANFGGSQNHVDLGIDAFQLGAAWDFDPRWTLMGGVERVNLRGHHDPAGLFNAYANQIGSTSFVNLDSTQTVPNVGLQFRPAKDMLIEGIVSFYTTTDNLPSSVFGGRALDTIGATAHPFSWDGIQVMTHFQMKF